MKLVLALLTPLPFVFASCLVDRRSSEYACSTNVDCSDFSPSRTCDTDLGYCVPGENECPDQCNAGCDVSSRQCVIGCTATSNCDSVIECPGGWNCNISCSAGGCDDIHCRGDSRCTISCDGGTSCGNIECDSGRCEINCSGGNACDTVDCNEAECRVVCGGQNACDDVFCGDACKCDVVCEEGTNCERLECPAASCKTAAGCSSGQPGCASTCS